MRPPSAEALPARLPNAQQIAMSRLTPRTDKGLDASMTRMLDYYREVQRAKDELARGEWVIPDDA